MLNNLTNFFNIITSKMMKKVPKPTDLIALGTRDARYGGNYKPTGILYSDLKADILGTGEGCIPQFNFKPGSVGPKVSFRKESGSDPRKYKDVIIPGLLEITRGANGGGIYNVAIEDSFNSNISPENTEWNTQYLDPANTSWAPLWDIANRTYDTWRQAIETPEGDQAPPQYVGMPAIMKYDDGGTPRYWLILFTEWGVGAYDEYNFAYDRYEIFPAVEFIKTDYDATAVDIISEGVHIKRDDNGPLYNAVNEPDSQVGVSPRNTKWNSIYTDSRPGYSGFADLSNLESRVYTDFTLALDYAIGNNILGTELIMHDLTTDLYYTVTFSSWTNNNNGGGFEYTRTVIPQSCGIKFADNSVLNTAPASGGGTTCCPIIDNDGNTIIDNAGDNLLGIGPGASHLIADFSGMAIINDHFSGRVETWIAGSGDAVLIGYTAVGSGVPTSTMTISGSGYLWTNNDNLNGPFTIAVIKTRNGS